ncbi:MAG: AAA family ATPase [Candidatus Peribacteraceae bacterium]|nr:AAA family ATPase [Candidatus Peribacteraceae bacterium]MDD5074760.1 AAA family ATPase [Candidatus Peribacteraceae bacterium]
MPRLRKHTVLTKPRAGTKVADTEATRKKILKHLVSKAVQRNTERTTVILTPCQEQAWALLQGNDNIFLTGAAGTGKSFLLGKYLEGKPSALYPVVASTGVSAILVGGRTFHSFFGIGIMEGGAETAARRACENKRVVTRLRRARGVVIDEISMLPGEALRAADRVARVARGIDAPWGGLQVIAVGDFAQLPPVSDGKEGKDWAFMSEVWDESDFSPALLSTCVRTKEPEFLRILNFVREGVVNEEVTDFLNARFLPPTLGFDGTRLFPHRATAEAHNRRKLDELPGMPQIFQTIYKGREQSVTQLRRNCPVPESLHLKKNALVMVRKNDVSGKMRYVNGSLGTLRHIEPDCLTIALFTGETVEIEKTAFALLDGNGNETAVAVNFPVNLAWASTIHKSQGATLDRLMVDLSSLWEPGQAYVALSRVRSAAGLFVERWNPRSIIAEPQVMEYYRRMGA